MAEPRELSRFIKDALAAGLPRDEIRAALRDAGWSETETEAALARWSDRVTPAGAVPQPVQSTAARDALFYALLFVTFGMVAGNVLALLFGQIEHRLPDPDRAVRYAVSGLRWSIAALVVFTPTFWLLDRVDARGVRADPSRLTGTIRRWLSALAMLIAVITLLGDALSLIYTFLDGQITARFLAKSAAVALIAAVVLGYFRQGRRKRRHGIVPAGWVLISLAVVATALAFPLTGGPDRGRMEQRDAARISDLRTLSGDVAMCFEGHQEGLPETLPPLDCARNAGQLTGFAAGITYRRVSDRSFDLCTTVEFPPAVGGYGIALTDDTACLRTTID